MSALPTAIHTPEAMIAKTHEFRAFTLGHEEYGIDILKVQEIRGYDNVTKIVNAPDFIQVVINLRGIIVLVVDMRSVPNTDYLIGLGTVDERMVVLIDID